jgi:hypothetical protein
VQQFIKTKARMAAQLPISKDEQKMYDQVIATGEVIAKQCHACYPLPRILSQHKPILI